MEDFKSISYRIISVGLVLLITFCFWQVFGESMRLWGFRIEVAPFLAAYMALFFGKEWGTGFSCFLGILLDCSSNATKGYYTLGLMIGAILISAINERYFRTRFFSSFFLGYILYLVLFGLRLFFGYVLPGTAGFSVFFSYGLPAGLCSLLGSLPTYYVLSRIRRRLED